MPKVSIVIPAYNAEKTLAACLDSALSQTLRDIEVICVNDGSTDRTREIIIAYMKKDSRLRGLSFNYCGGTVFARKMGIQDATGDYIMHLDADDLLPPSACESAVKLISEKNVDILQFGTRLETPLEMTQAEKEKTVASRELDLKGKEILSACFVRRLFSPVQWNKIYRAALLKKAVAAMPDVCLHRSEDKYMAFFYYYFAESFCSVKDGPFYIYNFAGNYLGKTITFEMFQYHCQFMDVFPLIEDFLRRRDDYDYNVYVLSELRNTIRDLVLSILLTVPDLTRDMVRVAVQHFGPDIMYDLVEKTGLLRVKCDSRMGLIPALLSRQTSKQQ
jgi:glycosyltransferase involved in cell wall biosynthesis